MIRHEIGEMFRDGTLAMIMAKYSYYGLDDTWATYDLMAAADRARRMAWGTGTLILVLSLTLWQAVSVRQRKRAEEVLRESEERFCNMADTAPVMIWVIGTDKRFTFFNRTWLDFAGRTIAAPRSSAETRCHPRALVFLDKTLAFRIPH